MSCTNTPAKQVKELAQFIDSLQADVIPLSIEFNKVMHEANITGNEEAFKQASDLQLKYAKIFADKDRFNQLKEIKENDKIQDELLKRQLDLLYYQFLGNQADEKKLEEIIRAESELEQTFTGFRAEIGGQRVPDNKLEEILKTSVNSNELKEAWLASKTIGNVVAEDVVQLVKLRNNLAHDLGFSNYHEMSLKLNEQDPEDILKLFNELDDLTRPAYFELKSEIDNFMAARYGINKSELKPWHYQDRFFQEAPKIYEVDLDGYYKDKDILEISRKFYEGIGMPVEDILISSDLYEKEGKNQHAYCTDIDRNGDVRILANIRNDSYWMNTMLHELGHGVYSKFNDRDLPFFLRDAAHIFTTEAIANMFGRFYSNPQWLVDNVGISQEEKNKIAGDIQNNLKLGQLVFSRWSQVMYRFEKSMYENPDQDLNALWWDLVEKYQLLTRPENRDNPDWASKIHIALYPCYYHNYLLGELLASQLYHNIGTTILASDKPYEQSFTGHYEVGKYLQDNVFMPGARYYWNDMIEKATGEKLTAKYYAQQFVN
ncbi:MAG: M2 family metallopeptidase [Bacteroidales bacterium]|nr:M2 family metallopeptidase [Bacteroidales bacterium]